MSVNARDESYVNSRLVTVNFSTQFIASYCLHKHSLQKKTLLVLKYDVGETVEGDNSLSSAVEVAVEPSPLLFVVSEGNNLPAIAPPLFRRAYIKPFVGAWGVGVVGYKAFDGFTGGIYHGDILRIVRTIPKTKIQHSLPELQLSLLNVVSHVYGVKVRGWIFASVSKD